MWVPDVDPVKSIVNMIESAESSGAITFEIQIQQSTLSAQQLEELRAVLGNLADIAVRTEREAFFLTFSRIGKKI